MGIKFKDKEVVLKEFKYLYEFCYSNIAYDDEIEEKAYYVIEQLAKKIIEIEPELEEHYEIQLRGLKSKVVAETSVV